MLTTLTATDKLSLASQQNSSLLCIGLDPDLDRMPAQLRDRDDPIVAFNRAIIEATADLACAYKPNLAFYEAHGLYGWQALERTIAAIPSHIPVILDAKRGDIGNTARLYARALFAQLGADAVTVNPYMGRDSIQPFVDVPGKLTFLLAATSNPGAADFQEARDGHGLPLYRQVARLAAELDGHPGSVGLVAGATDPTRLAAIRSDAPDLWLLLPGVGAQGGDLESSLAAGLDARGGGVLVNASRSVLYASSGSDFAPAARQAAMELRDAINRCRTRH
jgi:orotidine-5'-phosphate decarboxylase